MTKAIIFDFDGVITESMGIKENAFIALFKEYPQHLDEIIKLHREHGGLSRFEKFKIIYRDILRMPYSDDMEKKLGDKFAKYVYEKVIKCPYVHGAKEFLEKYHEKLSLFIASGAPEEEMRKVAKQRGISKYFVEIFGSPAIKGTICRNILEKYNFLPEETLMVGDAIDDYAGAKEAGILFIGRITKSNPFAGMAVNAIIRDLSELEKFINPYD